MTKRQQEALDLICENPLITIKEVGDRLGVAWSAAHDLVKALTKKGAVRRVGAKKNGRWEVILKSIQHKYGN